jgi:hypothetical protein
MNQLAVFSKPVDSLAGDERNVELQPWLDKALDDLTEELMLGYEYPRRATRGQINRLDILCEQDSYLLATLLLQAIDIGDAGYLDADSKVREIVRNYLRDSHWCHERALEMREQAKEDAETEADARYAGEMR